MIRKAMLIVPALMLCMAAGIAQTSRLLTDAVFDTSIHSIEFYKKPAAQSFPIITLNSNEELLLEFDDLQSGSRNLYYSIEHCDAVWNSSGLSPIDYIDGFTEERINNYQASFNTLQKYTHYRLVFPNASLKPKIAGNYILKVFGEGEPDMPLFTRRFYVLRPLVSVSASLQPSPSVPLRHRNHKINVAVSHPALNIQNPQSDARAIAIQNGRTDMQRLATRPGLVRGTEIIYNHQSDFDFPAGNEFRYVDLRNLRLPSEQVKTIRTGSDNEAELLPDADRSTQAYAHSFDENGKFYIANQHGSEPRTDADYVWVHFELATGRQVPGGNIYIAGQFNAWQPGEENKLTYEAGTNSYHGRLRLKQGVYNYQYVWMNASGEADHTRFEGSFFETRNSYQVLFYHRHPTARWEELVGFAEIPNN